MILVGGEKKIRIRFFGIRTVCLKTANNEKECSR